MSASKNVLLVLSTQMLMLISSLWFTIDKSRAVWQVHLAWIRTPRSKGGLGHMQIPILADVTKVRPRQHAGSLHAIPCPVVCQQTIHLHEAVGP